MPARHVVSDKNVQDDRDFYNSNTENGLETKNRKDSVKLESKEVYRYSITSDNIIKLAQATAKL